MTPNAGAAGVPRRRRPELTARAWRITAAYAVFASLWIYFSDQALAFLIPDAERLVQLSVYKGLAFVAVTSLLLLVLTRRAFGALASKHAVLASKHEEARAQRAELERINRLYAALSQVNQVIVRMPTRADLFHRLCDILVDYGGFRSAWIGVRDPETERIEPMAHAGADSVYVADVEVYADERAGGDGPSGIAFRSARPYICNDVLEDPNTADWRDKVAESGFRAAAVFPIVVEGEVTGLLSVYADTPHFFQDKEVELVGETAKEVAFGLESLESNRARVEAEHFANTLIESMPGILYMYDAEGRFLRWNRNFEVASGYSAQELATLHPLDLIAPGDRARVESRIAEVFTTGDSFVEAPFLSKDGRKTPFFFTGRRVVHEGEECLVGVGIDVSERVAAEHALRRMNETLERRVVERTTELETALVRAEAADRIKSAFLATMSHELRTPLNSIIGFTGIVLQGLAGPLTEEQEKQLGMVRGSARHLLELITDVLDLSKIEAGQLEVSAAPFDLSEVIGQVAGSVQPLADAKGLTLDVRVGPGVDTMVGDKRRVKQVLLNLLNNGIKFTDEGGVTLLADRCGGVVRLCVQDTGIGIREDDVDKLFLPFRQVDTGLSREHEGTGLGLAICQRLAMLMGGEISVSSKWREGSEFCVTLPVEHNP